MNSEFSFSKISCSNQVKEPNLPQQFIHNQEEEKYS